MRITHKYELNIETTPGMYLHLNIEASGEIEMEDYGMDADGHNWTEIPFVRNMRNWITLANGERAEWQSLPPQVMARITMESESRLIQAWEGNYETI